MKTVYMVELQVADIRGGMVHHWTFEDKGDAEKWARVVLNKELAHDKLKRIGKDESLESASDRWNEHQANTICNEDEQAGYVALRTLYILPKGTKLDYAKESA